MGPARFQLRHAAGRNPVNFIIFIFIIEVQLGRRNLRRRRRTLKALEVQNQIMSDLCDAIGQRGDRDPRIIACAQLKALFVLDFMLYFECFENLSRIAPATNGQKKWVTTAIDWRSMIDA